MYQVTEHHLQAPELPSHEHSCKPIRGISLRASIPFERDRGIYSYILTNVAPLVPQ